MVDLFELQDEKIVLTEICYTNKTFKEVMRVFKKNKNYIQVFQVLFYMTCPDKRRNPYWDLNEAIKEGVILRENALDFSLDEPIWEEALALCHELYKTPKKRLYLAGKIGMDNVADFLTDNKLKMGADKDNEIYSMWMNKLGRISEEFSKLEKAFDEEVLSAIRGGQEESYDEK